MATQTSQRPPKPAPVPLGGATIPKTVLTQDDEAMAKDISVSSISSRDNLRRDIHKRRNTLTREECQFLERLIIEGDEIEVAMAHENLLDDELFFDPENSGTLKDDSDRPWMSERGIQLGREFSINSSHSGEPGLDLSNNSRDSSRSWSEAMGSEKRREHLESRRKTQMLSRLWNAHANGIAVSKKSSRRVLMARRNSISSSSGRSSDLYARPETDAIFRNSTRKMAEDTKSEHNLGPLPKFPMDDIRSDNIRRRRRASFSHPTRSVSGSGSGSGSGLPRSPRRSSLRLPTKPTFRRLKSDVSRKSVSFKESQEISAHRVLSEGSLPPIRPQRLVKRRDSASSIPSIHHAHPIRSNSIGSIASFASIHLAHHVHSDSASDILSMLDTGDLDSREGRDPSTAADQDEKKVDLPTSEEWEIPSEVYQQNQQMPPMLDDNKRIDMATKLLTHDRTSIARPPVAVRRASRSSYHGEGFEAELEHAAMATTDRSVSNAKDALSAARAADSLVSFGNGDESTLPSAFSFDEGMSFGRVSNIFRRRIERSLSDENLAGIFLGGNRLLLRETSSVKELNPPVADDDDDRSWNLDDESTLNYYDAWKVIEDEYENGYGGGGALPFHILGTSGDDIDSHPHVLSPPLMESLQSFFPTNVAGDNFWMKYSLVRDGACLHTFLQNVRGAKYAVLAVETVDGEVFGCFTTEPWRKNWNYFGGHESFLWRMRHSRKEKCHSIIDQAHMESEIDVYPFAGVNNNIQLCTHDKIAVGGGTGKPVNGDANSGSPIKAHEWGFGLALEPDMLNGTSSPSVTFGSPSLSKEHADGTPFEIVNLELWTLTPCARLEDAEKLELGLLFLRKHGQ